MRRVGVALFTILLSAGFLLCGNAFAEENYFAELEKDLVNGELIIKAEDPSVNPLIFEIVYSQIQQKYDLDIDYNWENPDYYNITLVKRGSEWVDICFEYDDVRGECISSGSELERLAEKDITLKYTGVDQNIKAKIMALMNPIIEKNHWNSDDWSDLRSYTVRDLSFVNYVAAGFRQGATCQGEDACYETKEIFDNMASFSEEFREDLSNKNIQFVIDNRAGDGDWFYTGAVGMGAIMQDGYIYDVVGAVAAYTAREIYIPESTEDTPEEYVKAAQKRIDDYYEDTPLAGKFTVTYGDRLPEDFGLYDGTSFEGTDYYYLEFNNAKIDFLIRKDDSKMITPSFATGDISTNIEIHSDDPTIPLDSAIEVEQIDVKERADKIKLVGLTGAEIYDLSIFSFGAGIQTSQGNFMVYIPVSPLLNGKNLTAYWVGDDGTIEEHPVTIQNGFAVFETTHFSEYILGTRDGGNPQTLDMIQISIITFASCGVVLLASLKRSSLRR